MVPKNNNTRYVVGKSSKVSRVNDVNNMEDYEDVPEIEELYSSSDEEETSLGSDDDEDGEDDSSNEVEDSGDDYDAVDEDEESIPEDQGGSSSDEDELERQMKNREEESDDEKEEVDGEEGSRSNYDYDLAPRSWGKTIASAKHDRVGSVKEGPHQVLNDKTVAMHLHTDDFSSDDDDEDGTGNRIGRIPLHWYEEYDHIGYDMSGNKVMKQTSRGGGVDLLDRALKNDDAALAATVYDALNDKEVTLSQRQIELIRRIQAGAFAHPEFDANPDYVDYFSGVDTCISGIGSNRYEPKHRFQPSKWEKLMVRRLLHRLKKGKITMDYLTGKDNKNLKGSNKEGELQKKGYFLLWKGDEEDEIALRRGPMHLPAPKVAPPGHAESYNPSEEYLPTPEELKQWEQMDVKDRPHGLLIPQKFTSLRAVGAYEHSVRESFERCLDLYLCPRVMKRRLNIDP
jgi:ribosome biogenesis protein ERB1